MRIAIIGCGWVGVRLSQFLKDKNHYIYATTTSFDKISFLKTETYNLVAPEHPTIASILDMKNQINEKKNQRIISSEHFIQDFNYKFIHPNPKYF